MRRREFIAGLGSAAAWPLAAGAQQSGKLATIGYLGATTPEVSRRTTDAFLKKLRELGWIEGRNIAIEYRWAEGHTDRAAEIAAEFVRLKVDIIHTSGNVYTLEAKRATSAIPIVFAVAGEPVATGLVASLARPGGNLTGLSTQLAELAGKRVELLHEVIPGLRQLAVMTGVNLLSVLEIEAVRAAAGTLGIEVVSLEVRRTEDIALGFDSLKGRADALYVANSEFLGLNRMRTSTLALGLRLPTMYANNRSEAGGLMSYGANFPDLFRRSADFVDKILRGAKPADIPVVQPNKFELSVNLITAKALGLTIPETLLATADEVIR
jgi:putative tryptophan/tyrosine transport system substrate-binding protein